MKNYTDAQQLIHEQVTLPDRLKAIRAIAETTPWELPDRGICTLVGRWSMDFKYLLKARGLNTTYPVEINILGIHEKLAGASYYSTHHCWEGDSLAARLNLLYTLIAHLEKNK